jgi:hypothetical protein
MDIKKTNQLILNEDPLITNFLKFYFILMVFSFSIHSPAHAKNFEFSDWDILLGKHVEADLIDGISLNSVSYGKLKLDPVFHKLNKRLSLFSPSKLTTDNEKLAFWINVYNIFAVKIVLNNYPLKSIKDVGGFFKSVWKVKAGTVGGKKYSLDEIEHGILRKMGDPRIHTAIVCASISCPNLRKKSYSSKNLNKQLDTQMKDFLANPNKGMRINIKEQPRRIFLSPIFNWFAQDFKSSGGVRNFISPYVSEENRNVIKNPQYLISYMDYNWAINGN